MRRKSALLTASLALAFATLAFADTNRDFHDQDLRKRDFTGGSLNGANFKDAIVANAQFINTSLKNASFKGADITGAYFKQADLTGADLTETKGAARSENTNFTGANLEMASFTSTTGCTFKKADLQGANFKEECSGNDFAGADLRGANFRGVTDLPAATRFNGATYDDDTAWPAGFDPTAHYMTHTATEDAPKAGGADTGAAK